MNRVLRIVLIITVMFLLILWISTIINSCNKKKEADLAATESVVEAQDSSDVFEDLGDEFFEDGKDDIFSEDGGPQGTPQDIKSTNETASDVFDKPDPDAYTDYTGKATSTPSSKPAPSKAPVTSTYSDDAKYLVVAGSFLVKENADKMVRRLAGMGYTAEVRNFNYSQYHSVIAGRYMDQASAARTADKLKAAGISCYVHKRQP